MNRKPEWRKIQEQTGLVSCLGEHVEFNGTMVWPVPMSEQDYHEMKRAGFWITAFFIVAYLILAVLS